MSRHSADDDREDGDRPDVPEGVLRGIGDIAEGNTASKEDLESLLKYWLTFPEGDVSYVPLSTVGRRDVIFAGNFDFTYEAVRTQLTVELDKAPNS